MSSSSILKRILEGAASRTVDPNPPWGIEEGEAVEILRRRLEADKVKPWPTLAETAKKLAREEPEFMALAKSLGVTEEELREVRDESRQEMQQFIKIPVQPRVPLAERGAQATIANPAACAAAVTAHSEEQLGPQTIHHIEHLERQMKMAEMRLKETRAQLEELDKKVRDAACKAAWLENRYREMNPADVGFWVESEVFPALREVLRMGSIEKGGAF